MRGFEMKLRVALSVKFLVVILVVPASRAQEVQTPTTQEVVTLPQLLAEAERVHPAIKAEVQMIEAKRSRIPQVKSLPDPTVQVGWMGNIRPFSVQRLDPSSYRGISAMQEFPYPGKLKLRGQIAEKDVEAEHWNLEAARRQVKADVKSAYYELWAVDQALLITQKNKDRKSTRLNSSHGYISYAVFCL